MRITGILSEDEVDQIILKYLQEEYNIGKYKTKHHVELKWVRGPIEFLVTDPLPTHENEYSFAIEPGA